MVRWGSNMFQVVHATRKYGVNQVVTRHQWSRYAEPCYWQITSVAPTSPSKGKATGILTWRGVTEDKPRRINGALKRDWKFYDPTAEKSENTSTEDTEKESNT